VSGRAILRALIEGETDPERLLARTNGRLKAPRERLIEGLRGTVARPSPLFNCACFPSAGHLISWAGLCGDGSPSTCDRPT